MNRIHTAIVACFALVLGASAAPSTGADYDALPDGTPSEVAQLFHSHWPSRTSPIGIRKTG